MAEIDSGAFEARFRDAYDAIPPKSQPPFPGVEVVCRLVITLFGGNYIVTHRNRKSLDQLLHAHLMAGLFRDIITKDDQYPRKPDPASIEAILARNHLRLDECMLIGDRPLDLDAGRNAGITICLYGDAPAAGYTGLRIAHYDELRLWLAKQNLVDMRREPLAYVDREVGGNQ
jgi:phosphoglycolate phosphatase-like HAD superfamily hydrolase